MAKRFIIFLFIPLILSNCSSEQPFDLNSIRIVSISQHTFLKDHCKMLQVQDDHGKILFEEKLYCDPGSGCEAFLFETGNWFTLIDCNGQWYTIDLHTGSIKNLGWFWFKNLPENKIGVFHRNVGSIEYTLSKGSSFSKDDVYKFKDPT